jgi:hypothetical protein
LRYGNKAGAPTYWSADKQILKRQRSHSLQTASDTKLPTVSANESLYSKRELQRSVEARRLQASLGFLPDNKFIAAVNAGSFLKCTVIAADVRQATAKWGPQVAAVKARTTRTKPMPPPQEPVTRRRFVEQHMHWDIMHVNKEAVLVSRTEPFGVVLCACIENVTPPILRQSVRRIFLRVMFVVKFTSDNDYPHFLLQRTLKDTRVRAHTSVYQCL